MTDATQDDKALHTFTTKPLSDIFTNDTDIDRRQCKRVVPMRVLALGMGRTGTASLREALKTLGYQDCYHMMSASVENPADCRLWSQAFAAKFDGVGTFGREEWDQLLGHCQATCDWPAIAFAKELIEAYPEAKVILTTRDVNSWHSSVLKTVDWRAQDEELKSLSKIDYASSLYYPMLRNFWDAFFLGDFAANGKAKFIAHGDEIRSLVSPDNLLEYNVSTGWNPLSDFLQVPEPDRPFPHLNDGEHFVQRCKARNRNQMKNVALRYALNGVGLAVVLVCSQYVLQSTTHWPDLMRIATSYPVIHSFSR